MGEKEIALEHETNCMCMGEFLYILFLILSVFIFSTRPIVYNKTQRNAAMRQIVQV